MSDGQGDARGNSPDSLSPREQALERQVFAHFRARIRRALEDVANAPTAQVRRDVFAKVHDDISAALSTNTNAVLGTPQGAEVKKDIACRKGCAYCCYQNVGVTIIEAIAIASGVLQVHPYLAPQIASQAVLLAGMTDSARAKQRVHCVFLADRLCSIHEFRPMACRAYFSLDLKDCEEAFEKDLSPGDEGNITSFSFPALFRSAVVAAMNAACKEMGLQDATVELTSAVALVISDSGVVDRWLAGEQVFTPGG